MNIGSLFGGVMVGKDSSGSIKLSLAGLAVRSNPGGGFVALEGKHLIDVTDLTVDGAENYIYRIPVEKVNAGDLIIRSENPLSFLFVREGGGDGAQIKGLDPANNEEVTWEPPTNLLKVRFFVKAVSLLDGNLASLFEGITGGTGSEISSLLPLLLLTNKGQSASDPITTLLLLRALRAKDTDKTAMLMLLLMKGGSSTSGDPLLFLLATRGELGGLGDLFKQQPGPEKASAAKITK